MKLHDISVIQKMTPLNWYRRWHLWTAVSGWCTASAGFSFKDVRLAGESLTTQTNANTIINRMIKLYLGHVLHKHTHTHCSDVAWSSKWMQKHGN